MPEPLVSIITVNYNQPALTCELLGSIRRQNYRNLEVIVVDNGSAEDPRTIFARYPEVVFVRSVHNRGFAGGNNLGLEKATGDYLFFLNNDAELTDDCIALLIAFTEKKPQAGIVSPLICHHPSTVHRPPSTVIQYAGMTRVNPLTGRNRTIGVGETDRGQFDAPLRTSYAHGAAMFVPRETLERAGPMREDFFLYYEELDWCERIRRAGYGVWVEPRARVFHKESGTVKNLGPLKTYYLTRNRILFMRRHYGDWRLYIFFLYLIAVAAPKSILFFLWRGERENLDAFLQGVWWHCSAAKKNAFENAHPAPDTAVGTH